MKKQIIVAIFFPVSIFCSLSVAANLDDLAKSVVYIREDFQEYEINNGEKYEVWLKDPIEGQLKPKTSRFCGTGFITDHNGKIYLVTAAHIARNLTKNAEVFWNTSDGGMQHYSLGFVQKKLKDSKWFFHPSADIAIHPFGFTQKSGHMIVPQKIYWDFNSQTMPIGTKVYILGYPLSLGIAEKLSPLSKKAEISSSLTSIYDPAIDPNLLFVLLDQDLAQGYSGAPVFISPELSIQDNTILPGKTMLVGIQSMTMSDQTGGKISLVVPTQYLLELFDKKDFRDYEKKHGIKVVPKKPESSKVQ